MVEVTFRALEKTDEERVGLVRVDRELPPVQPEKDVCREERDSLVAVDERVVHQERFEHGGRQCRWGFGGGAK